MDLTQQQAILIVVATMTLCRNPTLKPNGRRLMVFFSAHCWLTAATVAGLMIIYSNFSVVYRLQLD